MKLIKIHITLWMCCLTAMLASSCIEEFDAKLPESENNLLVVDGSIVSDSTCVFTLSRSFSLNENRLPEDYNHIAAKVMVTGTDGSHYEGTQVGTGKYAVNVGTLKPEHSYYLQIEWEGHTYTSSPQQPLETEEMTLSFEQPTETSPVYVQISTPEAKDNETSYYIWHYKEDWEIRTQYRCKAVYDPYEDRIIQYDYYPYAQGWVHMEPGDILINSTESYQGNRYDKKNLYNIPRNNPRISYLYSTLVTQRKISKGEYEYYRCKQTYTNEMGGLFTPQPSELPTNISCKDADRRALGYVGVNMNVSTKRMYISEREVNYEQDFKCGQYSTDYFEGQDFKSLYYLGYRISFYSAVPMSPPVIHWSEMQCVDCRVWGADPNGKPDFWPESNEDINI